MTSVYLLLAAAWLCSGCRGGQAAGTEGPPARAGVVDSILPMDVMIARFQAAAPHAPRALAHGASSRDELIERFARALRDSSGVRLRALRLDVSEFAHLYFPTSAHAAAPFRQPPGLAWLMIEQNGLKGESRLLRRFGGTTFTVLGHSCEPAPTVEGDNRLWRECTVRLAGAAAGERLFGSIIERAGHFKFVSLANNL